MCAHMTACAHGVCVCVHMCACVHARARALQVDQTSISAVSCVSIRASAGRPLSGEAPVSVSVDLSAK